MKTLMTVIFLFLCFQNLLSQTMGDTLRLEERKFMKGESWEWRIEGWDANKNGDLVVDYNFYPDGVFIKYQRVENTGKPYDEVKTVGRWVKDESVIYFKVQQELITTEGEFNADISPTVFKIKTYKVGGKLLKSTNLEFKKLPFMKIFEF